MLIDGPAGAALPAVTTADYHTAEVDYLNAAVREQFGLTTVVLRSLHHDAEPHGDVVGRAHELHSRDAQWTPRRGMRWAEPGEVADVEPWFEAWRAERAHEPAIVDGREWTRPGWWDDACAWLGRTLRPDWGAVEEIVQRRAWETSCVLSVRTRGGEIYFKAVAASLRRECAVTAYLAQHAPVCLPRVIAIEPERRWLLTESYAGPKLEAVTDIAAWERAAAMYAQLQVACIAHVPALRALGCATREPAELAAAIEPLCADTIGLSLDEITRLRAAAPELRRRCAVLAGGAVPLSLEHGDLWPGNFLVGASGCVLIDWEEAGIGHPFLSLAPLLAGLAEYQPGLHSAGGAARLRAAYAEPFAGLAPLAAVREAIELAAPLAWLDMALRYRRYAASIARQHPWMRPLVPQALRAALVELRE